MTKNESKRPYRLPISLALLAGLALLPGCASLVSSAAEGLAQDLGRAILNQDDPKTVQDGAPAYLLLLDGLIEGDPDNPGLLLAAARLYGSYAGVFVSDPARARRLAGKARRLSERALCRRHAPACDWNKLGFEAFRQALERLEAADVPALYTYASAWAGWIQAHPDDWNALAELPRLRLVLERVAALDEGHDHGGVHLYLGYLASLLPPALGGKPQEARAHFERAIALSGGRSLMAKVLLAERYARAVLDRELHDRLLQEVLAADPHAPGLTLMNVLAQERARALLASAEEHF